MGVELLILFGSRARGQAHPDSDLDVGALFAPGVDADLATRLEVVRGLLGGSDRLDLVLLNRADPLLLHEVTLTGRSVFEAYSGALEEFRIRAVKRYFDTEWLRKAEAEVLRARYG
ncbi:MAG: type VII toxin-antitoxin system MntA family adenylyltransferase antitoxin [Actinomycetota bacterium]